ncbi:hypothetical protein HanXRQr2_Chr15g0677911 [Helianthus annuus]|uniref:Uncharacterized protein n=1 Tax=Helianthus annuus TaxID=4232 RepID=A0A9K3DZ49_HELAN|nr:hypothetical protein HanXRQr2_Chr15g0677911 [Helianthus annuus]KAJ0450134.1 hypothetical protein HanHA300_Chr15g0553021 [Helianthus annuus]KAJ0471918.1 hypothetical protein HanHA89_Chr15g0601321 [Helianthus annuus]KAJ0647524.1 hypothetical protein HanLR1_Chr15g0562771 [Helianthus annuus]KAJ0651400.1 hypothetical protein HanOQP8_Chr15g0560581 [Helianthus annuus]
MDRQASSSSTSLLLTGGAQNKLCMQLAESSGVIIKSPWVGILMAFINMTIWGLVRALRWKIIGLY